MQLTPQEFDFKVNSVTGEAFVSIRKTAELIDMPESTLRDHLKSAHPEYDRSQGLTPEMMQKVVKHRALAGSQKASILLDKLMEAGAKAFIYQGAGVTVTTVVQSPPLTALEAYKRLVEMEENRLAMVEHIAKQDNLIKESAVLTESSDIYLTIKQIRAYVSKPSGKALSRVSEAMGYEVKKVFSQYDGLNSNSYHVAVINAVYGTQF